MVDDFLYDFGAESLALFIRFGKVGPIEYVIWVDDDHILSPGIILCPWYVYNLGDGFRFLVLTWIESLVDLGFSEC